jgi:hypothetical protein
LRVQSKGSRRYHAASILRPASAIRPVLLALGVITLLGRLVVGGAVSIRDETVVGVIAVGVVMTMPLVSLVAGTLAINVDGGVSILDQSPLVGTSRVVGSTLVVGSTRVVGSALVVGTLFVAWAGCAVGVVKRSVTRWVTRWVTRSVAEIPPGVQVPLHRTDLY